MIAPPRPPSHDELEALIKEARARQLRRRLLGAASIATAAAAGLGIYATLGSHANPSALDRERAITVGPNRSRYTVFSKFRCDIGVSRSASGTFALTKGAPTASFVGGPAICKPGIRAEGRIVLVYPFEPTQRLAYLTSLAQT
jgi:hypothetical protein